MRTTFSALVCIVLVSGARADVVTIGSLYTTGSTTSQAFSTSAANGIAQEFYYSQSFTLSSLSINLYNTSTSNDGNYTVSLYQAVAGLPSTGTELGSGTWQSLWNTTTTNVVNITGLSSVISADTHYWIGILSTNFGPLRNWTYMDSNSFGNNTTDTNYAFYNGTSWTSQGNAKSMGLQINGETVAVPEPTTMVLTGPLWPPGDLGHGSNAAKRLKLGPLPDLPKRLRPHPLTKLQNLFQTGKIQFFQRSYAKTVSDHGPKFLTGTAC